MAFSDGRESFIFAILPPKCTLPCAADPGTRIWWAPALYRALGASLAQPEKNLEGRGLWERVRLSLLPDDAGGGRLGNAPAQGMAGCPRVLSSSRLHALPTCSSTSHSLSSPTLNPSPLCYTQRLLPTSSSKSAGPGTGNGDPVFDLPSKHNFHVGS